MSSKWMKCGASLGLIAATMLYAGNASAKPSSDSFSAQAVTSSPINLDLNLFPRGRYVQVLDLDLPKLAQVSVTLGTSPVPEPESIALMGVGLALVGFAVRRRRGNSI